MAKQKGNQSTVYILIVASLAFVIAWAYWKFQRPFIIKVNCHDAAVKASQRYDKTGKQGLTPDYNSLYTTCLEENGL